MRYSRIRPSLHAVSTNTPREVIAHFLQETRMYAALRSVVLVGACLVTATSANAQTCLGLPSSRANLTGTIGFPEGAKTYGARLGVAQESLFGGVGVNYRKLDDFDASQTSFGVDGGMSLQVAAAGSTVRLCPVVSLDYATGPNLELLGNEVETTGLQALGGLALGGIMELSPGVSIIPNALASVLYNRFTIKTSGPLVDDGEESSSETGGLIAGGVTFLFNNRFGVQPRIAIPVGFDEADPVFSLSVHIGFGNR
jgi:hypothetical protein